MSSVAINSTPPISIHAPLRGATNSLCYICSNIYHFYPRTPAGCDSYPNLCQLLVLIISIHAPLRGATYVAKYSLKKQTDFYPRTPAGCDLYPSGNPNIDHKDFYPRTPAGCDLLLVKKFLSIVRFLSTHPCGVRLPYFLRRRFINNYFYPRTPAGCDKPYRHHL